MTRSERGFKRIGKGKLALGMVPACVLLVLCASMVAPGPRVPAPAVFPGRFARDSNGVWWTMQLVSSESSAHSYNPSVAVDGEGNVHVAWHDWTNYLGSSDDIDIFYKVWNATLGTWLPTEVVFSLGFTGTANNPAIAVDGDGNVHVVWQDTSDVNGCGTDWDIFYSMRNATEGSWSPVEVVSIESSDQSSRAALAVDGDGNVHVVWDDATPYGGSGPDYDIYYNMRDASTGLWTGMQVVSTESTQLSNTPSIAVDGANEIHVAWWDMTFMGHGTDSDIFYKSYNGSWSGTEVASIGSNEDSYDPSIAVDAAGNVHVAWQDHTDLAGAGTDLDILYNMRNATLASWGTSIVVSTESTEDSGEASLAVDAAGNVHVAWQDPTDLAGAGTDADIFYKQWNSTVGSWTTTEIVSSETSQDSQYPSMAVGGDGTVHVVWQQGGDYASSGADYDIFYKMNAPNQPPSLTSPPDISYDHGETGNVISWVATDESIGATAGVVYQNGTAQLSVPGWTSGIDVVILVDGLDVGIYNYTLVVDDGYGGTAQDTVIVTVLNVAPTITHPADFSCEQGTSQSISWTVTDLSTASTSYQLYYNSNPLGSPGSWVAGVPVTANIDTSSLGPFNYTILASDGLEGSVQDTVIVTVNPNTWPSITSPDDVVYVHGVMGNSISWNVTDASVGATAYMVYRNLTSVATDSWTSGVLINISVDGLDVGTYTYQISASDGLGGTVQDEVLVTVTNVAPAITSPANVTYTHGTTGHSIAWTVTDASIGTTFYTVYRNGTAVGTSSWTSGTPLVITVDGLAVGRYNYTIVATDGLGASVQDEVLVTVTSAPPPPPIDPGVPGFPLLVLAGVTMASISLVVARLRRREE